jgi:[CysO sulfur-carrier protein]-S-L-cysteine hydrolase
VSPALLAEVCAALERAYPAEGCGVILEGGAAPRVHALRNAYAGDPREGYAFDPHDWLALCRAAEARAERIAWVFHSHVDGGAYLSAADRAGALAGAGPLLPGARQLIVAVVAGRAQEAAGYRWQDGEFREEWRWRQA